MFRNQERKGGKEDAVYPYAIQLAPSPLVTVKNGDQKFGKLGQEETNR